MRKIALLLVALCLVVGMSGAAWAETWITLGIVWDDGPLDSHISSIDVIFYDNAQVPIDECQLDYVGTAQGISFWSLPFDPEEGSETFEIFIDTPDLEF